MPAGVQGVGLSMADNKHKNGYTVAGRRVRLRLRKGDLNTTPRNAARTQGWLCVQQFRITRAHASTKERSLPVLHETDRPWGRD